VFVARGAREVVVVDEIVLLPETVAPEAVVGSWPPTSRVAVGLVLVDGVSVPVPVLLSLVVMVAGSMDDMLLVLENDAYVKLDPVGGASGPVIVLTVNKVRESDAGDWASVVEATRQRLSHSNRILQRWFTTTRRQYLGVQASSRVLVIGVIAQNGCRMWRTTGYKGILKTSWLVGTTRDDSRRRFPTPNFDLQTCSSKTDNG